MAQIEDGKTVTVRATQPGSYLFRIQAFSSLPASDMEELDMKCFESPQFESSGHKWKISVYPYGDKKRGVRDHVSLYLVSTDDDNEPVGSETNVTFKMFVYDFLRDNFLTIQDGEVRRFHKLKKEWGFARLISLARFKDPENGYLLDGSCLFGVEIFVIPTVVQIGYLSLIKGPTDGIFTWKLNKFSTLGDDVCCSEVFRIQGHQWKLAIYPNGNRSGKGTHLSLYLKTHSLDFHGKHVVHTAFVLRLRNHLNDKWHHETKTLHSFVDSLEDWGFSQFLLLDDLRNPSKGFLLDDSVTFEVEVNFISKTGA